MNRDIKTSLRKLDHLRICFEQNVERGRSGFEDVHLLHNALPEINKGGLVFSGSWKDRMEICEIPGHPFFLATQFHPEFRSRPTRPSPPFVRVSPGPEAVASPWGG
jgi:CTP synthase (UTP-ammonia lyase)